MPKAIIFGVNGQDGFYLGQLLQQRGVRTTGVSRSPGQWLQGDVGNREFTEGLIKSLKPDYIFHLAANSKTDHELIFEHQSTIVAGTLNILETVLQYSPASKVFITGSGLQFENSGKPISEQTPFLAGDAYSLARIQSVYAGRYYRSRSVKVYAGYLFHHDSPRRTARHLNRRIADAAIAAGRGEKPSLVIGDVAVGKEFGFAGDIAKGIFHLLQQEDLFEACIGTGKAYRIEKWLELCFSSVGKNWKDYVQPDSNYTEDFKKLVSNPSAINKTGWQAETGIDELAELMLKPHTEQ
ncbi:MAG: GDP-mannose 4,6-dehydratase [Bacteroidota bacterium]